MRHAHTSRAWCPCSRPRSMGASAHLQHVPPHPEARVGTWGTLEQAASQGVPIQQLGHRVDQLWRGQQHKRGGQSARAARAQQDAVVGLKLEEQARQVVDRGGAGDALDGQRAAKRRGVHCESGGEGGGGGGAAVPAAGGCSRSRSAADVLLLPAAALLLGGGGARRRRRMASCRELRAAGLALDELERAVHACGVRIRADSISPAACGTPRRPLRRPALHPPAVAFLGRCGEFSWRVQAVATLASECYSSRRCRSPHGRNRSRRNRLAPCKRWRHLRKLTSPLLHPGSISATACKLLGQLAAQGSCAHAATRSIGQPDGARVARTQQAAPPPAATRLLSRASGLDLPAAARLRVACRSFKPAAGPPGLAAHPCSPQNSKQAPGRCPGPAGRTCSRDQPPPARRHCRRCGRSSV